MLRVLGKAGASRWRGIRPTVRGTAMNSGRPPTVVVKVVTLVNTPVTPWGVQTKGKKTRKTNALNTLSFIVVLRNNWDKPCHVLSKGPLLTCALAEEGRESGGKR